MRWDFQTNDPWPFPLILLLRRAGISQLHTFTIRSTKFQHILIPPFQETPWFVLDLFIFASLGGSFWCILVSQLPGTNQLQVDARTYEGGSLLRRVPSCCFHPSPKTSYGRNFSLGFFVSWNIWNRFWRSGHMYHVGAHCFHLFSYGSTTWGRSFLRGHESPHRWPGPAQNASQS